jgi:hypothetical protein
MFTTQGDEFLGQSEGNALKGKSNEKELGHVWAIPAVLDEYGSNEKE